MSTSLNSEEINVRRRNVVVQDGDDDDDFVGWDDVGDGGTANDGD